MRPSTCADTHVKNVRRTAAGWLSTPFAAQAAHRSGTPLTGRIHPLSGGRWSTELPSKQIESVRRGPLPSSTPKMATHTDLTGLKAGVTN
jgi:hypothetical protein